jgi:hypothetical protein
MKAVLKKLPIDLEITGVTLQALQVALSTEHRERESLPQNANQTSVAETPTDTRTVFAYTTDAGAQQRTFFKQAIEHTRNVPQVKNPVLPTRGYRVTSDTIEHSPIYSTGKETVEKVQVSIQR